MSWMTVGRAADAARGSDDGLLQALSALLDEVRRTPKLRREHETRRYAEAAALVPSDVPDAPGYLDREGRIRDQVQLMELTCGRIPVMDDRAVAQGARTARTMLREMGMDQGGEVWPGQCAWSATVGQAVVCAVQMDGSYLVRARGMYTYPDDAPVHVGADDVGPRPGAEPHWCDLVDEAERLVLLVRSTARDGDGWRHGGRQADDVALWCELLRDGPERVT